MKSGHYLQKITLANPLITYIEIWHNLQVVCGASITQHFLMLQKYSLHISLFNEIPWSWIIFLKVKYGLVQVVFPGHFAIQSQENQAKNWKHVQCTNEENRKPFWITLQSDIQITVQHSLFLSHPGPSTGDVSPCIMWNRRLNKCQSFQEMLHQKENDKIWDLFQSSSMSQDDQIFKQMCQNVAIWKSGIRNKMLVPYLCI
jgi:hypothetical protein